MRHAVDLVALEASLSRRHRVVETSIDVAGHSLAILHPVSAEDLIDERDFDRDERLPYWAELWPSSRVLGELVAAMHGDGRTMLDLGCGSGLVSVCGALAGFRVVASDYYDDAIRFARVNAHRNGTALAGGLSLDWRHLPADLQRFDAVVASDVLYEQPYGELVARAIDATLGDHGVAYIADPGRVARDAFLAELGVLSLVVRSSTPFPFVELRVRQTIVVFEIERG